MKTIDETAGKAGYKPFLALLLLTGVMPLAGKAQGTPPPYYPPIEYHYDARGNRIQRNVLVLLVSRDAVPDSLKVVEKTDEQPAVTDTKLKEEAMATAMRAGVSVYPNPATAHINVTINTLTDGKNADVVLFDNIGRVVARKKQMASLDKINVQDLVTGVYFLQVTVGAEVLVYKIIKE